MHCRSLPVLLRPTHLITSTNSALNWCFTRAIVPGVDRCDHPGDEHPYDRT
jgi:hypothetical protein